VAARGRAGAWGPVAVGTTRPVGAFRTANGSSLKLRQFITSKSSAVRLSPTHNSSLPSCAALRLYSTTVLPFLEAQVIYLSNLLFFFAPGGREGVGDGGADDGKTCNAAPSVAAFVALSPARGLAAGAMGRLALASVPHRTPAACAVCRVCRVPC